MYVSKHKVRVTFYNADLFINLFIFTQKPWYGLMAVLTEIVAMWHKFRDLEKKRYLDNKD